MLYKGNQYNTFGDIFNKGLEIAKSGDKSEAEEFYKSYIQYIIDDTGLTLKEAKSRADSNFGYFAGYYSDEVRKLMKDTYGAIHPIFGDNYNIDPAEAFRLGQELAKRNS